MTKLVRPIVVLCLVLAPLRFAAGAQECSILTAADVQKVTGANVHAVAKGSSPGAGGKCGNYATADGKLYLGVNQLTSASEYSLALRSVPEDIYPKREKLSGVGAEAVLM